MSEVTAGRRFGEVGVVRSRSVTWLVDTLDAVLAMDGLTVVSAVDDPDKPVDLGVVEWALALGDPASAPGG
ncbi:hypothetical protein ACTMTI_40585 [Nonomuraea sp. H19]|uniref:hypothetical protein n=1 Tax=Nonomuraea sp. H19 TaxID=3452206 RepID=UPI003F8B6777